MAKFIKTPVKGMCDQLPADMRLREHVLSMIKTSYSRFGFTQIETCYGTYRESYKQAGW